MHPTARLFAPLSAILVIAAPLYAQLGRGAIVGAVTDPTGAAVPGAVVTVTNTGTNNPFRTRTNSEGYYATPGLVIGEYEVAAEAAGFKRMVRGGITLQIDQRAQINLSLEVGDTRQSIEVNADAVLVDTESATGGKVVGEREIQDLPLNGRNAFSMLVLTPGVNNAANPINAGFGSRGAEVANVSINGGATGHNSFTIDGGNNNNTVLNEVNANPAVDSIAEFKVQSNTMSAEHGFTLGGVVNVATRSGTNAYHGTAYEFLRNDAFDARNSFATTKPFLRYNQYGGTLGGPVFIPKLYQGRNRTFFFFNYETYDRGSQSNSFSTVPTPLERSGDFSQTRTAQGAIYTVYDPSTTAPNATGSNYVRTPFPDNIVPSSRFDPVTTKMLSYVALPNNAPINAFTNQNNFYSLTRGGLSSHQLMLRGDQRISARNQMYVRYMDFFHRPKPSTGGAVPWEISGRDDRYKTRNFIFSDTHTFGSAFVNDVRLSLARQFFTYQSPSSGQGWPQKLGLPASFPSNVVPTVTGQTFTISGASPGAFRAGLTSQLVDSVTWVHGRHTTKFGVEMRRNQANTGNLLPCDSGSWGFGGGLTQNPASPSGTGVALAQFLLGAVGSGNITCYGNQTMKNYSVSPYVQEDWKVARRLNLNIGLRYDYQQAPHEAHNRSSSFDPSAINPVTGLPGVILWGTVKPLEPTIDSPYNFSPRFGFAYSLTRDSRTVLRGGYSIFYATVHNLGPSGNGYGSATTAYLPPNNIGHYPAFNFKDGITVQPSLPLGEKLGPVYGLNGQVIWIQTHQPNPQSQQWSLSLQRQFGRTWVAEAMYSANHGTHLQSGGYDANQRPETTWDQTIGLADILPNPYYGRAYGAAGAATVQRLRLYLPWPWLNAVNVYLPQMGNSIYHAGLFTLQKRMNRGFSMLASYTWSKLISDGRYSNLDYLSEQVNVSGISTYQDGAYNRRLDRALDPQNISHRVVASSIYELPFGRGKRWNAKSRLFQGAAAGWQLNGIAAVQTGVPVMVSGANNYRATRPNNIGTSARLETRDATRWFDTQVFTNPAIYMLGTTGRTLPDTNRPGFFNLDLSLMKHFRVTETSKLQFRWETFNTPNNVMLMGPNTSFVPGTLATGATNTSALFGRITSSRGARSMQVALKLIF